MHEPDGTWHEVVMRGGAGRISPSGVELETLKRSLRDLSKLASETSEDDGVAESVWDEERTLRGTEPNPESWLDCVSCRTMLLAAVPSSTTEQPSAVTSL